MYNTNGQRSRRRLTPKGLAVILGLLAVLVAAAVFGLTRIEGSPAAALTKLPFGASAEYGFTSGGMLYIEGSTLYYSSLKGEKLWEMSLTGEGYRIESGSSFAVLYTDTAMQAIGTDGAALFPSQEFSGRVLSVRCGKNYIATLKSEENGSKLIYLYDLSGVRVDRLELKGNALLDYGFDADKDVLWTLMVNANGSTPVSTISTYNVANRSDTGAMTKEGEIFEAVRFSGGKTYAAGTNHLFAYSETGKEEVSRLIYGWRVLDQTASSKAPAFLLAVRQSGASASTAAKIITLDSEKEYQFRLPAGTLGAFFREEKVLVVEPGRILTYDLKGKQTGQTTVDVVLQEAWKEGSRLIVRSGEELYLIP